ncbi:hypothetical protein CLOM_g18753 [Closterium sp. NIES-68]|nr:hypothetical protein CLOM_g18753 [Closterium sp. NIES-68]GJP74779.1 hypothetical protein CLOP_g5317 [Closterium sp. NIES-67]
MAAAVRQMRYRSREAAFGLHRLAWILPPARSYTTVTSPTSPHTLRSSPTVRRSPTSSAILAPRSLAPALCAARSASVPQLAPQFSPQFPPPSKPLPASFAFAAISPPPLPPLPPPPSSQSLPPIRNRGGRGGKEGGWGGDRWGSRRASWAGAGGAIAAGLAGAVGVAWGEARSGKGGRKNGDEGTREGAKVREGEGREGGGEGEEEEGEMVSNWSGTHEVRAAVVYRPESMQDLERLVQSAHRSGRTIRPIGSGISPNGIALNPHGMVNLALMDRVLHVDKATGRVRVQAGARVEQVVDALRPYGLTLQNYASVREQQIGGFIQVGAHGTGASIPPVDEQVVAIKLVTPGRGTLHLTPEADPDLFYLARCGLGALGVVGEVELQAVPAHRLREETFVTDKEEIKRNHCQWLQQYQHIRYMWIPHTQAVVVVRSNPVKDAREASAVQRGSAEERAQGEGRASSPSLSEEEKLAHVRALYLASVAARRSSKPSQSQPPPEPTYTTEVAAGMWSGTGSAEPVPSQRFLTEAEVRGLSFTRLRDELLALDPLNLDHVRAINQAEALYWKLSQGEREGWSDEILGFDCGGQQWVSEVCFKANQAPTGTHTDGSDITDTSSSAATSSSSTSSRSSGGGSSSSSSAADIAFMEELLAVIESEGIPAPAPIEQRWTSGSRSPMSPTTGAYNAANAAIAAAGPAAGLAAAGSVAAGLAAEGRAAPDDVYSWVGIIMYLPSNDPDQRAAITKHFLDYKFLTARRLWDKYGAHEHWAKIEIPSNAGTREWLVSRVARDCSVGKFNEYRRKLDPRNVLANEMLDVLFPR